MTIGARKRSVSRLTRYLQSDHSPRLEMTVILASTGLAGFLVSVGLLRAGVNAMWLRYPLAATVGYLVFLALVWNLVRLYRQDADRALVEDGVPLAGSSGGSGRFDGDVVDPSGCLDFPGDEGCAVVAALGVVLCLGIVAVYFVASAPVLLAELVLDSLLVGGLYRRLRREDECGWFVSALRKTIGPALIVIVFLTLAGIAFSQYAPEARSIGAVVQKWRADH